ncbi:hypothetical protein FVD53_12675 [Enterococcus faecium]|nr:hypothetical protein [Enterococcus faecium]MCZ1257260.1 hypothetical protein [Enterococcus faecium]MCZ1311210.1 hypothetical protein [Enterococcus faecium]MCZ1360040.1 hypothetical protein [Enterococcus faecium]RAQ29109.1 hypothetical protein DPX33_15620 [Enterococcus faecium]
MQQVIIILGFIFSRYLYKVFYGFYRVISMNPFLFLQIGVDTRIMRVLNYYCNRNNKRKKAYAPCLSIHLFTRTRSMFTLSRI